MKKSLQKIVWLCKTKYRLRPHKEIYNEIDDLKYDFSRRKTVKL